MLIAQLSTFCDPTGWDFQARTLKWVAIPFSLYLLATTDLPWAASSLIFHREKGRNFTCILSSFLTWAGQSPCLTTSFLQAGTIFTASCTEKSWRTILNPHALEVPWIGVILNALSRQTGCRSSVIQAVVHLVPSQDNGVLEEKKEEGSKWRNSECKMNVKGHSDTWLFSAEQGKEELMVRNLSQTHC